MDKLLLNISRILTEDSSEESINISNSKHFLSNNFNVLDQHRADKTARICFIDGGNGEILGSSAFSLNFNKISRVLFCGRDLIKSDVESFFSLAKNNGDIISFEFEPNFLFKQMRSDISVYDACCLVRSCKELIVSPIFDGVKIIVIDGSFDNDDYLGAYFEELKSYCLKNKIFLFGISKTSSMVTNKSRPVSFALNEFSKKSMKKIIAPWVYFTNLEQNSVESCFVKLHQSSEYVLRLDFLSAQKNGLVEALETLCLNCSDPVFLGYPFGLFLADDLARVSKQDLSELKAEAFVKLGKDYEAVSDAEKSSDAHSILDRAKF